MEEFVQNLVNGLSLGSLYALLALGIALVFGIMRLLNFAHGELLTISAYVLFFLGGIWFPLLLVAAILVTVIAALAMERIAFRPVRSATPTTLLITSFAVSFFLQNLALLIFGSSPRGFTVLPVLDEAVTLFGFQVAVLSLVTVGASVVLASLVALFLKRHRTGFEMRAAAEDFEMARLLGVKANRVIGFCFAIGGILAAVAGTLYVAQTGQVSPTMGITPVILGFIAAVIGGMSSLPGAAGGGMILGLATVVLQAYLPEDLRPYRDAFLYAVVIAILFVYPSGIFAGRSAKVRRV